MTPERIRELALANGFKLKTQYCGTPGTGECSCRKFGHDPEGCDRSVQDLNPYVYDFVKAVLAEPDENDAHNFANLMRIDNYLLSKGLLITLHTEETHGPLAPAENVIASIEAVLPKPDTITVDRDALYRVLMSLDGPGYAIRELQATRGPLFDNPIDKLITQFNEQVRAATARREDL